VCINRLPSCRDSTNLSQTRTGEGRMKAGKPDSVLTSPQAASATSREMSAVHGNLGGAVGMECLSLELSILINLSGGDTLCQPGVERG
jgi:hypothetical protein